LWRNPLQGFVKAPTVVVCGKALRSCEVIVCGECTELLFKLFFVRTTLIAKHVQYHCHNTKHVQYHYHNTKHVQYQCHNTKHVQYHYHNTKHVQYHCHYTKHVHVPLSQYKNVLSTRDAGSTQTVASGKCLESLSETPTNYREFVFSNSL
jgi:hypothetical protein